MSEDNTNESVFYQLTAGMTLIGVGAEFMETLIVQTVARLPEDVRRFVCDSCCFATVGNNDYHGQTLEPGLIPQDSWIILLDSGMTAEMSDESTCSVIAHEIAHAWLGHDLNNDHQREAAAEELVRQWGFAGIGVDRE